MKYKIVADSSANMLINDDTDFSCAPLKILTKEKEYIDDENLNVDNMVNDLLHYKGKSSTSCPSPDDWLSKFDNAECVFCVTITSGLSGSYNSACIAKSDYESKYPERRVYVIDSLTAGPALKLIVEQLRLYIKEKLPFESICDKINTYKQKLGTLFVLESMKNLANNGRVSHLAAKMAGLLGIRAIGTASDEGTIALLEKARGNTNAFNAALQHIFSMNYSGGRLEISHCNNLQAAEALKNKIKEKFANAKITVSKNLGLCSFYAENGGLIIGFEKD